MKSNVIHINNNEDMAAEVLQEVEHAASYNQLDNKTTIMLRLLAEELIGLQKGILGFNRGEFFLDDEDGVYKLHLNAKLRLNLEEQERFVDIATNHKNDAYKGFTGKLRMMIDSYSAAQAAVPIEPTGMQFMESSAIIATAVDYDSIWTLNSFRDENEGDREIWDELEKSILVSIADDIIVGTRADYVDITVIKKF